MKISSRMGVTACLICIAAIVVGIITSKFVGRGDIHVRAIKSTATVPIGGPFRLVNQKGQTVTNKDVHGKHLLIFFGFSNCPDVCPMAINEIALTLKLLKDKADQIQAIFVSVDPERDTPEILDKFIAAFDERIMGLTGTIQQIEDVTKAYRIYYQKALPKEKEDQPKDKAFYQVDHSAIIYLMSPTGEYIRHFSHGTSSDDMAKDILKRL